MKTWNNDPLVLRPADVAQAFARENFSGPDLDWALKTVEVFLDDPSAAKRRLEEFSVREFPDAVSFYAFRQFSALFAKSMVKGKEKEAENRALSSFLKAEQACKRANRRLRWYYSRSERENPVYRVILSRTRELIRQVLGNLTENTLAAILDLSRPGGGMAIGTTTPTKVSPEWKLGKETRLVSTTACLPYAAMLVEGSPCWFRLHAEIDWDRGEYSLPYQTHDANRVAFVPKDGSTARTIAVEPHLNMCLQKGVGDYISRRLASRGIFIRDQSVNQKAAQQGAAEWETSDPYVTLDLSAASDSLSIALVERLLPPAWVGLLDDLRSKQYMLRGEGPFEYQKWSSMGNGYTFPLETLIFWALASVCSSYCGSSKRALAYGDDIIVARGSAALLIEVLGYCGFKVNTSKSFIFGPFRESCGKDWYGTQDVTPLYLRWMTHVRPTDSHRLLNWRPVGLSWSLVASVTWAASRGRLILGFETPDASSCVWTDLQTLRRHRLVRWNKHLQAWTCLVARFRPTRRSVDGERGYAAALLGSRKLTSESQDARFVLKRKGSWTLTRVVGYR